LRARYALPTPVLELQPLVELAMQRRLAMLMRPRGVGGLRRVFLGRASEIELLRATFRRARRPRHPRVRRSAEHAFPPQNVTWGVRLTSP